jgi:hypothetical protein
MANDEDLARLRQGVAVWNDWREQNRKRRVDLSDIDLWRPPRSFIRAVDLGEGAVFGGTSAGRTSAGRTSTGASAGRTSARRSGAPLWRVMWRRGRGAGDAIAGRLQRV